MKKKKQLNKTINIILGLGIFLLFSFSIQQFIDYRINFQDFNNIEYQPVDNASNISTGWRYIVIKVNNPGEVLEKVKISTYPIYDYKVKIASQRDLYSGLIPQEQIEAMRQEFMQKTKDPDDLAYFNDLATNYYSDSQNLVIERLTELYKKDTRYTVLVTYKKWNLFNNFLGKEQMIVYSFQTNSDNTDELDSRRSKYLSTISSRLTNPPSAQKYEKEKAQKCPYTNITFKFTNVTKDYLAGFGDCSIDDKNLKEGEEVKVIVISKDFEAGKVAFRAELAKYGLKESPTLRVNYTHEPKTEAEIKKLLDENKGN